MTVLSSFVSYQVLNYLLDPFLGSLHTVLGSLQCDPLTVSSCAREANGYTAVLLRQLPQHLTSPTHEVPVVANVYYHAVLHHVILEELSSFFSPFAPKIKTESCFCNNIANKLYYQVFHQTFQLLLGLTNSFLLPYDGDQFLLGVIW